MKRITLALLGATLLSPAALAQSTPPASTPSTTATSSASGSGSFMQQAQSGQWRASKLVGVDIYGPDNQKVGDVKEVLMDSSGNAKAVVIGVGGFLGIGEKNVGVAFSEVKWSNEPAPRATASNTSGAGGAGTTSGAGPAGMSGNTAGTVNTGGTNTGAAGTGTTATTASTTRSGPTDYPDHGTVSWTKDQLKNAPDFKYASDTHRGTDSGTASRPATGGATSGSGSTNR
jgi:hypothetical protein